MNCIQHPETGAVSFCARCGAGLCHECATGTFYQIDSKPLCAKCNYEVGCENDRIFQSVLRGKQIRLVIFTVTFVLGLAALISGLVRHDTGGGVFCMLFLWGLGFIGNFFDKQPDTRSVKAQVKDAAFEIQYPVASLVGKIISFFIMAVTSPIQIAALLIGIGKVKKQRADNTALLSKLSGGNG